MIQSSRGMIGTGCPSSPVGIDQVRPLQVFPDDLPGFPLNGEKLKPRDDKQIPLSMETLISTKWRLTLLIP